MGVSQHGVLRMKGITSRAALKVLSVVAALGAGGVIASTGATAMQPQAPSQAPQQPSELNLTISGDAGSPPRLAVPDFIALSTDAETVDAAKTIGRVLWD